MSNESSNNENRCSLQHDPDRLRLERAGLGRRRPFRRCRDCPAPLTPASAAAVNSLLGENTSLASVSSWADDFKFPPEGVVTKPWHFVDIEVSQEGYAPADCPASGCLVSALQDQAEILGDTSRSAADRRRALLLLIHLVGDSTQPFHCGERAGDGGRNRVRLDFEGVGPDGTSRAVRGVALHALWDDTLIDDHT